MIFLVLKLIMFDDSLQTFKVFIETFIRLIFVCKVTSKKYPKSSKNPF